MPLRPDRLTQLGWTLIAPEPAFALINFDGAHERFDSLNTRLKIATLLSAGEVDKRGPHG